LEGDARTCQAKGRFLRFSRAKRMARNFQRPLRPERPSFGRSDSRLKVDAMVRGDEGAGEVAVDKGGRNFDRLILLARDDNFCLAYYRY